MTNSYSTADLIDRFESEAHSCATQFLNLGGRHRYFGSVRTVTCLNDNALIKLAFAERAQGAVLVVDGGGSLACALVGDMMAGMGAENGWSGVIVSGAVRDCSQLRTLDFGVKALGTNPLRSGKTGKGARDVPVVIGNAEFHPGDWVYCDLDDVIVAPVALHERMEKG